MVGLTAEDSTADIVVLLVGRQERKSNARRVQLLPRAHGPARRTPATRVVLLVERITKNIMKVSKKKTRREGEEQERIDRTEVKQEAERINKKIKLNFIRLLLHCADIIARSSPFVTTILPPCFLL